VIYGVSEAITRMVLRRLEKSRSWRANRGLTRPAWWSLIRASMVESDQGNGFAVTDRGTTSLNRAWDLEATWPFNHNIFGRALHGPRPRPIRLWSRGREDPAFVFALCFV
ncbi:unnamed protein product, partial [Prunus brigantina]